MKLMSLALGLSFALGVSVLADGATQQGSGPATKTVAKSKKTGATGRTNTKPGIAVKTTGMGDEVAPTEHGGNGTKGASTKSGIAVKTTGKGVEVAPTARSESGSKGTTGRTATKSGIAVKASGKGVEVAPTQQGGSGNKTTTGVKKVKPKPKPDPNPVTDGAAKGEAAERKGVGKL